jgi:glycosyltransferase involved in cell wall biosynthesis
MRIAHVVDYYMPLLGYQESLLPKWHARHGHEVHVVTSDRYADVPNYDEAWAPLLGPRFVGAGESIADGVSVHRLRSRWERRNRLWLKDLDGTLERIAPDVVFGHGTTNYTSFALARHARRSSTPLLLDCHMMFTVQDGSLAGRIFYALMSRASTRLMAPHVEKFYGVADECCEFLVRAQGLPQAKVDLLPLGLDTDIFRPDPEGGRAIRQSLGLADGAIVVMQTGKLTPDKGPRLLAEAVAPLMARDSRVHVVFVGGGGAEYLAEVRHSFELLGVADRVHFVPLVPARDLSAYFSAADICVFPAASSLSAIEAAGCGAGVVMTDLPAGRWREAEGIGTVFADGDAESLRGRIGGLISVDGDLAELRASAVENARAKFSYERVSRHLEAEMVAAISRRHAVES